MPGSVTSAYSEAENFQAALRAEGCLCLLVTGAGPFKARLTQIVLHHLRLLAGDEYLPRVALVAVPANMILVALPRGKGPAPIWGGRLEAGEILTLGAGQRLYMRTDGPCRWVSIWLSAAELVPSRSALTGTRRLRAKRCKKIVDIQAARPSSWKRPCMATCMAR